MARIILYAVPIILMIFALFDCLQNQSPRRTPAQKAWWILAIVFIPLLGPLAWILVTRILNTDDDGREHKAMPVAPDDDPEFLRKLDEDRWRQEQKRRHSKNTDPAEGTEPT